MCSYECFPAKSGDDSLSGTKLGTDIISPSLFLYSREHRFHIYPHLNTIEALGFTLSPPPPSFSPPSIYIL